MNYTLTSKKLTQAKQEVENLIKKQKPISLDKFE